MFLSKYAVHVSKKWKFIKGQEDRRLLSSLAIEHLEVKFLC